MTKKITEKKHKKNCQCRICDLLRSAGTPNKPSKGFGAMGNLTGGRWG